MSAPGGGAPSPAPRSGSIGPNASMPVPQQQPIAANPPVVHTPTTPGPSGPSPAPVSQQNLNQIVSSCLFRFKCLCLCASVMHDWVIGLVCSLWTIWKSLLASMSLPLDHIPLEALQRILHRETPSVDSPFVRMLGMYKRGSRVKRLLCAISIW